jgi:TonB family protein
VSPRAFALAALLAFAGADPTRADPPPPVAARPPLEDAVVPGPTLDARLAEIQRRIQAALVYPPIARKRGLGGETHVAFTLTAEGRAHGVETVETSGSPTLDRAAEDAVAGARDLPFVHGRLVVPVRFDLRDVP